MRSKPVRLWKNIMFILFNDVTFHYKNHIDRIRLVYRTEYQNSFFLGGEGGRGHLFEVGRLLQMLSLRSGANLKRGAYLKLGANSSINSTFFL